MEEDHGEKEGFGETGHFRAGVVNPGPVLGRAFGNAKRCESSAAQRRLLQAQLALQFGHRRVRDIILSARPVVVLKQHAAETIVAV